MPDEKFSELCLITTSLMMFPLVLDVIVDGCFLRKTDTERTVIFLPMKVTLLRNVLMDPFRGNGFESVDELGL